MVYTDEQKAEAVRLYLEVGAVEAAKTVGCTSRSIYLWLGDFTDLKDEKREQARQETAARHQAKREALREAILDAAFAGALAAQNIGDPKAYQALSIGVGTFLDKYRLEQGETTGRTEVLGPLDLELTRIADELQRTAT